MAIMKRAAVIVLALMMLLCTGCSTVILANGTLSVDSESIKTIQIQNGLIDGNTFTVQDRDTITTIVKYINSYTLEDGETAGAGYHYFLRLLDSKGEVTTTFTIVSASQVISGDQLYQADAQALLSYVEKQECKTMTDQELIDRLFTGSELDNLNILDEKGKISLDKIAGLTDACPTLFELVSRPTVLQSVGSYGIETIKTYLSSDNSVLKERAETLAEILREYIPDLQAQIDKILQK